MVPIQSRPSSMLYQYPNIGGAETYFSCPHFCYWWGWSQTPLPPTRFLRLCSYLSAPSSEARSSPSKHRRLVHQRQQSEWLDADHIQSYEELRKSIVQYHTSASIFDNIKLYSDHVMLYSSNAYWFKWQLCHSYKVQ